MDRNSIIRLAIKYCTDEISDEEKTKILKLSTEDFDLFYELVQNFSPNIS